MERIKKLNGYQKALLIIMIVASMVFAIIYPKTVSRVGFRYMKKIFVPEAGDDGSTIYSGRLNGKYARFVVYADNTVEFYHGDDIYSSYTVIYDPTAIPERHQQASTMTGVEIREGDEILFRGGMKSYNSHSAYLYPEKGTYNAMLTNPYMYLDGFESIDDTTSKPNPITILALTDNPKLTHNGSRMTWFIGSVLCIFNAFSMIFFDELFRFEMYFSVSDPENVEPSSWMIMTSYISWTLMTVFSIVLFMYGLRVAA